MTRVKGHKDRTQKSIRLRLDILIRRPNLHKLTAGVNNLKPRSGIELGLIDRKQPQKI